MSINKLGILICCISIEPPMELTCRACILVCSWWSQMGIVDHVKPAEKLPAFRVHYGNIYHLCPILIIGRLIITIWTTITCFFVIVPVNSVFVWVHPWECNYYFLIVVGEDFIFWNILIVHEFFVSNITNNKKNM